MVFPIKTVFYGCQTTNFAVYYSTSEKYIKNKKGNHCWLPLKIIIQKLFKRVADLISDSTQYLIPELVQ